MFLWLDTETAIYIKLKEGMKLSFREVIEMLKHINLNFSELFERIELKIKHKHDFRLMFDYAHVSVDEQIFDEQSSFNLANMDSEY